MKRRTTALAIEPSYSEEESINLIDARDQYSILITCFLLQLANDQCSMEELLIKREEWQEINKVKFD